MIPLTGGVIFEKNTRYEGNMFVHPNDPLRDCNPVPPARHSLNLGTA
jgi:hypothetical protein